MNTDHSLSLYQVDAFTDRRFAGNPAAVVLLDQEMEPAVMQSVAAEMDLSETAFIGMNTDQRSIRYFTPTVEVPICGHATLASAHVLWEAGIVPSDRPIVFKTLEGQVLTSTREGDFIAMDLPADPPAPAPAPPGLAQALGVEPVGVARSRWDWLVELASEQAVRSAVPDLVALARIPRGVVITAQADDHGPPPGTDFVSRCFFPSVGIDEDPVTGSLHAALGPYWAPKLGKRTLSAYQASARGGRLRVTVGDGDGRVEVAGRAVTVLRGQLLSG